MNNSEFFDAFNPQNYASEGSDPSRTNNTEYYDILGAKKTDTCEEIRKKYRKKAIKYHPDHGGDSTFFAEMTQAKNVLTNRESRAIYDRYGVDGIKKGFST